MDDTIVMVSFAGLTAGSNFSGSFEYSVTAPADVDLTGQRSVNPEVAAVTFNGVEAADLGIVLTFGDNVDSFGDGTLVTDVVGIGVNAVLPDGTPFAISIFLETTDNSLVQEVGLPDALSLEVFDEVQIVSASTVDGIEFGELTALSSTSVEAEGGISADEAMRVARLYEAALDRDGEIDLAGLNFWIDRREEGLAATALAEVFIRNPEFEEKFGEVDALSDLDYVQLLYRNILDREGEDAGIGFWTSVAEQDLFTRAEILLFFADSPENIENTPFIEDLAETAPGFWEFGGSA